MMDQKAEEKYIKCYYLVWITIVVAAFLSEICGLSQDFHTHFLYILFGLYVSAIGLWALYEKKDISYLFLGISFCFVLVVICKIAIYFFS